MGNSENGADDQRYAREIRQQRSASLDLAQNLQLATEKKLAAEIDITTAGKTFYGSSESGRTIPARIIGGRTERYRFSVIISDGPVPDPRWAIGESRVVKLSIIGDRGKFPSRLHRPKRSGVSRLLSRKPKSPKRLVERPNFEWNLGLASGAPDSRIRQLIEFITHGGLDKALQLRESVLRYQQPSRSASDAVSEPRIGYVTGQKDLSNSPVKAEIDASLGSLKTHWETAIRKIEQIERSHSLDAVEHLRDNLEERLKAVLSERTRGQSHYRGHGR